MKQILRAWDEPTKKMIYPSDMRNPNANNWVSLIAVIEPEPIEDLAEPTLKKPPKKKEAKKKKDK